MGLSCSSFFSVPESTTATAMGSSNPITGDALFEKLEASGLEMDLGFDFPRIVIRNFLPLSNV